MIKLTKSVEPLVLKNNKAPWLSEYLTYYRQSAGAYILISKIPKEIRNRYNHADIKMHLRKETYDKCAYCESKISHNSHGDIEHILPKCKRPDLVYEWNNLTFACEYCNRSCKGSYYKPTEPLLNPYLDDPDQYFYAVGPIIFDFDDTGCMTKTKMKLNRSELLERRSQKLDSLQNLIRCWRNATAAGHKEIYRQQLLEEMKNEKEYSFIVRGLLKSAAVI